MKALRRIVVNPTGEVSIVRFVDRRVIDPDQIQEIGNELLALIDEDGRRSLLLNFHGVDFLSSGALNMLVALDRKVKSSGGRWKLCGLRPEIRDVFTMTRLHRLFEIHDDQASALKTF